MTTTDQPDPIADDLEVATATFSLSEGEQEKFAEAWDEHVALRGTSMGVATIVDIVRTGETEPASFSSPEPEDAELDRWGRAALDPAQDPDELLADPLAFRKIWRAAREEGLTSGFREEEFESQWRLFVDLRLDLVKTLRAAKAKDDAAYEARGREERERPAREAAAERERVKEELVRLRADEEKYALFVVRDKAASERRGHDPVVLTFPEWLRAGKPAK